MSEARIVSSMEIYDIVTWQFTLYRQGKFEWLDVLSVQNVNIWNDFRFRLHNKLDDAFITSETFDQEYLKSFDRLNDFLLQCQKRKILLFIYLYTPWNHNTNS